MKKRYENKDYMVLVFSLFLPLAVLYMHNTLHGEDVTFCRDKRIGELIRSAAEEKVKIGGSERKAMMPRKATQYISQYLLSAYPPSDSFITHKYSENAQQEFRDTILKLDSLINCSSAYSAGKNKKYRIMLQVIQNAYEFFKKTVADARKNYEQNKLLFSQYIKNNDIYPTIQGYLTELVRNVKSIDQKLSIEELKKEAGNKSLSQIFPNYELFFKEYNKIKTKFENQSSYKLSSNEIFYLLVSMGVLKINTAILKKIKERGVCDSEIDKLVMSFVDKLEKFSFRLDKSWFVSNKKLMQKDIQEITYALRAICPILFQREYSKISELQDYPLVFIGDASLAIYEWLRMFKDYLLDLEKK